MTKIYLGIGSNVGNKKKNIDAAVEHLQKGCTISRISPLYNTEPIGDTDQEWFLNAVVEADTSLEPLDLLTFVKEIEKNVGRTPTRKNGPRIIDIDILFYDDCVMTNTTLTLPHPHLHERLFVLIPLMDLAPTLLHPVLHQTIEEIYRYGQWNEQVVRSPELAFIPPK